MTSSQLLAVILLLTTSLFFVAARFDLENDSVFPATLNIPDDWNGTIDTFCNFKTEEVIEMEFTTIVGNHLYIFKNMSEPGWRELVIRPLEMMTPEDCVKHKSEQTSFSFRGYPSFAVSPDEEFSVVTSLAVQSRIGRNQVIVSVINSKDLSMTRNIITIVDNKIDWSFTYIKSAFVSKSVLLIEVSNPFNNIRYRYAYDRTTDSVQQIADLPFSLFKAFAVDASSNPTHVYTAQAGVQGSVQFVSYLANQSNPLGFTVEWSNSINSTAPDRSISVMYHRTLHYVIVKTDNFMTCYNAVDQTQDMRCARQVNPNDIKLAGSVLPYFYHSDSGSLYQMWIVSNLQFSDPRLLRHDRINSLFVAKSGALVVVYDKRNTSTGNTQTLLSVNLGDKLMTADVSKERFTTYYPANDFLLGMDAKGYKIFKLTSPDASPSPSLPSSSPADDSWFQSKQYIPLLVFVILSFIISLVVLVLVFTGRSGGGAR